MRTLSERKRLNRFIDIFPKTRILVVGDIVLDHYIWGKVSRISPEAPVPVVHVTRESLLLGGATNVVNNINSLGGLASVCGLLVLDQIAFAPFKHCKSRALLDRFADRHPDPKHNLPGKVIFRSTIESMMPSFPAKINVLFIILRLSSMLSPVCQPYT